MKKPQKSTKYINNKAKPKTNRKTSKNELDINSDFNEGNIISNSKENHPSSSSVSDINNKMKKITLHPNDIPSTNRKYSSRLLSNIPLGSPMQPFGNISIVSLVESERCKESDNNINSSEDSIKQNGANNSYADKSQLMLHINDKSNQFPIDSDKFSSDQMSGVYSIELINSFDISEDHKPLNAFNTNQHNRTKTLEVRNTKQFVNVHKRQTKSQDNANNLSIENASTLKTPNIGNLLFSSDNSELDEPTKRGCISSTPRTTVYNYRTRSTLRANTKLSNLNPIVITDESDMGDVTNSNGQLKEIYNDDSRQQDRIIPGILLNDNSGDILVENVHRKKDTALPDENNGNTSFDSISKSLQIPNTKHVDLVKSSKQSRSSIKHRTRLTIPANPEYTIRKSQSNSNLLITSDESENNSSNTPTKRIPLHVQQHSSSSTSKESFDASSTLALADLNIGSPVVSSEDKSLKHNSSTPRSKVNKNRTRSTLKENSKHIFNRNSFSNSNLDISFDESDKDDVQNSNSNHSNLSSVEIVNHEISDAISSDDDSCDIRKDTGLRKKDRKGSVLEMEHWSSSSIDGLSIGNSSKSLEILNIEDQLLNLYPPRPKANNNRKRSTLAEYSSLIMKNSFSNSNLVVSSDESDIIDVEKSITNVSTIDNSQQAEIENHDVPVITVNDNFLTANNVHSVLELENTRNSSISDESIGVSSMELSSKSDSIYSNSFAQRHNSNLVDNFHESNKDDVNISYEQSKETSKQTGAIPHNVPVILLNADSRNILEDTCLIPRPDQALTTDKTNAILEQSNLSSTSNVSFDESSAGLIMQNLRRLTAGKWRRSVAKWKHEKGRRPCMVLHIKYDVLYTLYCIYSYLLAYFDV